MSALEKNLPNVFGVVENSSVYFRYFPKQWKTDAVGEWKT
jgi:hypothetical protein